MYKNKYIFYLFFIFTLFNLIDIILASINHSVESNPIFLLFKSMWIFFIYKLLMNILILIVCYHNKFKQKFYYFSFISILVFGCFGFAVGIYTGIVALNRPDIVQLNSMLPQAEKLAVYSQAVLWIYLIPYILNLICFWIYDKSYKNAGLIEE